MGQNKTQHRITHRHWQTGTAHQHAIYAVAHQAATQEWLNMYVAGAQLHRIVKNVLCNAGDRLFRIDLGFLKLFLIDPKRTPRLTNIGGVEAVE